MYFDIKDNDLVIKTRQETMRLMREGTERFAPQSDLFLDVMLLGLLGVEMLYSRSYTGCKCCPPLSFVNVALTEKVDELTKNIHEELKIKGRLNIVRSLEGIPLEGSRYEKFAMMHFSLHSEDLESHQDFRDTVFQTLHTK